MSDRRVPRYYEHISANADQHLLESGPVDGGHDLDRNAVRVGVESQVQKSDLRGGQRKGAPKCFGRLAMVQVDRAGNELTNRALD
jgi:hypothetical protein